MTGNSYEDEIEIINPECEFTEKEGLKFLADAKFDRPTYEHGIRFSQQHGKATTSEEKPFVIFLHEAWLGPRYWGRRRGHRIVCLGHGAGYRELDLADPDDGFTNICVLAGVRRRK